MVKIYSTIECPKVTEHTNYIAFRNLKRAFSDNSSNLDIDFHTTNIELILTKRLCLETVFFNCRNYEKKKI